jgi:hypothetical protein
MFLRQKGILPITLFVIGLLIHVIGIACTTPYVTVEIYQYFLTLSLFEAILTTIQLLAFWVGVVWSIPLLIGSFFVAAFPEIRLDEKGIEYRSYKCIRSTLLWEEIENVVDLPRGYKAILINRKGFTLINGLYSNQIYGDVVKIKRPVLLLSPKLENIETVLTTIYLHNRKSP